MKGLKIYVRMRTRRKRRRKCSNTLEEARELRLPTERLVVSFHQPTAFRHNSLISTSQEFPNIIPNIPSEEELETWFLDLWEDFLIEPTPYLVCGLLLYLGGILLLSNYHAAIWRLSCFLFRFLPWDYEDGWDYLSF
ncbi:hypothetical protein BDZ45DRAFT_749775 [Acephala macrosclerotiorum]|nr:hypothetical protein BDZ45DRAFT_749775 [Acephala macrosclerotiorum]